MFCFLTSILNFFRSKLYINILLGFLKQFSTSFTGNNVHELKLMIFCFYFTESLHKKKNYPQLVLSYILSVDN
jgi:hypothetical protein